MRLLFFDTSSRWSGRAHAFLAAGRAMSTRGYHVTFACPAASPLASSAAAARLPTIPVATDPALLLRAHALRRALLLDYNEILFVHGDDDHLAASLAIRATGRGAVVRRLSAGERLRASWRWRAARRLAPVTYLLTGANAPEPPAHPAMSVVRGELGVSVPGSGRADLSAVSARAAPRLACLASRESRRDALNVLRAVALLAERHSRVRLMLGGSAARLEELRLHAAALHISKHVHFLVGDGEAHALHAAELAWVVAEGDEAAFSCLQVMASGVPLLTRHSDVAGHLVEHGVHGLLFPVLEPPAMAAAISVYAADPEQRERIGREARARVERHFTEREMANGFEQATRAAREHVRDRVSRVRM